MKFFSEIADKEEGDRFGNLTAWLFVPHVWPVGHTIHSPFARWCTHRHTSWEQARRCERKLQREAEEASGEPRRPRRKGRR
jgi:hypothetical protein